MTTSRSKLLLMGIILFGITGFLLYRYSIVVQYIVVVLGILSGAIAFGTSPYSLKYWFLHGDGQPYLTIRFITFLIIVVLLPSILYIMKINLLIEFALFFVSIVFAYILGLFWQYNSIEGN